LIWGSFNGIHKVCWSNSIVWTNSLSSAA